MHVRTLRNGQTARLCQLLTLTFVKQFVGVMTTGLSSHIFERKIVNIFLPISFNIIVFGAQKNHKNT